MKDDSSSKPRSSLIMRSLLHRFLQKQQEQRYRRHHEAADIKKNYDDDQEEEVEETYFFLVDDDNDDISHSNLPNEVHLQILSFLDLQSLNRMRITNKTWQSFLQSPAAYRLWLKHCQKIWNLPSDYENDQQLWNLNLIDDLSGSNQHSDFRRERGESSLISLHTLLSKTSCHPINDQQQLLLPTTMNPLFEPSSPLKAFHQDGMVCLQIIYYYNTHQAFSARADCPLPRPTCYIDNTTQQQKKKKNRSLIKRCLNWTLRQIKYHPQWNAFVSPYSTMGDPLHTINVTPRLVSYFEITVQPKERDVTPELGMHRQLALYGHYSLPWVKDSCVVIGLAPMEFDSHMELLGWEGVSFGYHSDTGGLYHGDFYGMGAIHENTEPFGTGDTVGMGIDYERRGVFVTKNGKLLGLFFDRLKVDYLASTDLYPVVGMDSKDTVVVNYGGYGKPFLFDLAGYCQQQQKSLPPKRRIPRT